MTLAVSRTRIEAGRRRSPSGWAPPSASARHWPAPGPLCSFRLREGVASIYQQARDIDPATWKRAFGHSPKDFEYYELIESTMSENFAYRYLVLYGRGGEAVALQPLILTDQNLAASADGIIAKAIQLIRRWRPRFLRRFVLMAGCLVGDSEPGVIAPHRLEDVAEFLAIALTTFARSQGIALVVLKDWLAGLRSGMAPFLQHGFTRIDGFPPLSLNLDFSSFDDYLTARLGKTTRKGLRRKLRNASRVIPSLTVEVTEDCSEVIDEIYPLYLNVARRSPVQFEVFTREYFVEAGRRMPGRFRFFIWRQAGKAVAFSFCTIWNGTIYDNDIGLDYEAGRELNLYSVTFRDVISWALKQGLKNYRSAPFNYDTKLHLRMRLQPVDIYVKHHSRLWNAIIRIAAPRFTPTRLDPVLHQRLRHATN